MCFVFEWVAECLVEITRLSVNMGAQRNGGVQVQGRDFADYTLNCYYIEAILVYLRRLREWQETHAMRAILRVWFTMIVSFLIYIMCDWWRTSMGMWWLMRYAKRYIIGWKYHYEVEFLLLRKKVVLNGCFINIKPKNLQELNIKNSNILKKIIWISNIYMRKIIQIKGDTVFKSWLLKVIV